MGVVTVPLLPPGKKLPSHQNAEVSWGQTIHLGCNSPSIGSFPSSGVGQEQSAVGGGGGFSRVASEMLPGWQTDSMHVDLLH